MPVKDMSFLPTKPVRLPPVAKVISIKSTLQPLTFHLSCNRLNIPALACKRDEIRPKSLQIRPNGLPVFLRFQHCST